jgi:hypothetical protein
VTLISFLDETNIEEMLDVIRKKKSNAIARCIWAWGVSFAVRKFAPRTSVSQLGMYGRPAGQENWFSRSKHC